MPSSRPGRLPLASRLPVPPLPQAQAFGRGAAPVWRIHAEATLPDGVTFARDAVVRPAIRSSPAPDYAVVAGRRPHRAHRVVHFERQRGPANGTGRSLSIRRRMRGAAHRLGVPALWHWWIGPNSRRWCLPVRAMRCNAAVCDRCSRSARTRSRSGCPRMANGKLGFADAARIRCRASRGDRECGPRSDRLARASGLRRRGRARKGRDRLAARTGVAQGRSRCQPRSRTTCCRRLPMTSIGTRHSRPTKCISMRW